MSYSTLQAPLRCRTSRKPTWIILCSVMKVQCRITCPITHPTRISRSVRGRNQKLFYPKIPFPGFLIELTHPSPHRTNLILQLLQVLLCRLPYGPIIQSPRGILFRFYLGTCPILQNIPMSLHPTSLRLSTQRYI